MPASRGTLLDWKPTGPAGTWGELELWGWHMLQGHPSKDQDATPERTMGPTQGHPSKDHRATKVRAMGHHGKDHYKDKDHPIKDIGTISARIMGPPWQRPQDVASRDSPAPHRGSDG